MSGSPANANPVGLLLAGGAAQRMGGQQKALAPFRGRALANPGIDALRAHCDRVLLSAAHEGDLPELGLPVVADRFPGAGPLAGLHAGLLAAEGAPILVLPCDLPLITAEDLAPLIRAAPGHDVVLYRHERGMEPLIAWYGPGALPAIEAVLRGGGGRISQVFERIRARYLPWTRDLGRLTNVNTRAEMAALERAGDGIPQPASPPGAPGGLRVGPVRS
jgi:molybdopterin-guanine dinucleotide biosynthesis protein A